MSGKKEMIGRVIGRCAMLGCLAALIALFVIVQTAVGTRAEGEIILFPGDRYPIPCLMQLSSGREYDIAVENPDIVGLDETGRCIVAVAVGTTEVTVRMSEPDEAYTYIFAVAEYGGTYQTEGDMTGEAHTGALSHEENADPGDTYADAPAHRANAALGDAYTDELPREEYDGSGDINTDEARHADADQSGSAHADETPMPRISEPEVTKKEEPEVTGSARKESMSVGGPQETDAAEPDKERAYSDELRDADVPRLPAPPVTFTHGTGKYDILVPDHYTIWICGRSREPLSILYVGDNGYPLPYRTDGNMIYIDSADIPYGRGCIQVLAADKEGRIGAMTGYEIVRAQTF